MFMVFVPSFQFRIKSVWEFLRERVWHPKLQRFCGLNMGSLGFCFSKWYCAYDLQIFHSCITTPCTNKCVLPASEMLWLHFRPLIELIFKTTVFSVCFLKGSMKSELIIFSVCVSIKVYIFAVTILYNGSILQSLHAGRKQKRELLPGCHTRTFEI